MTPIITRVRTSVAVVLVAVLAAAPAPTLSQDLEANIDLAGSWAALRAVELDSDSSLEGKARALIGLAVAAEIACGACVHVSASLAKAYGATDSELAAALAMAGLTRRLGVVLDGVSVNSESFRAALGEVMSIAGDIVASAD